MGEPLSKLESAVLDLLMSRDQPGYDALRAQRSGCSARGREQSSAGFYTELEVSPDASPADMGLVGNPLGQGHDFPEDVAADIEGLESGAGFLLWLKDGRLSQLEGYSYLEDDASPVWDGDFSVRWEPINRGTT